jgi:membrane protein implicated in regulation of membrane protease activity
LTILYWHWIVFGMLLMAAELAVPSFTIFWFGLGAIPVALLLYFSPDVGFGIQIAAWTAASIAFTLGWFRYMKPQMDENRTLAGMSREAIVGQAATVIAAPVEGGRGTLRFTVPIVGRQEWAFFTEEPELRAGERVVVKDISGNTLIVSRQNKNKGE